MASLLETAAGLLTPDVLSRASSLLGESNESVSNTLNKGAIPALLAGLGTMTQERGGPERLLALLRDPAFDARAVNQPGSLLGEGAAGSSMRELGGRLLALLFGGRTDSIVTSLAEMFGMRASSASSLLRMAAPLVLGVIGDRVKRDGLDAGGLANLLRSERVTLPTRLRDAVDAPVRASTAGAPVRSGAPRWLLPALALLALLMLWTFLRGSPDRTIADLPDVAAARPSSEWVTKRLPTGTELRFPSNGIEVRVVDVLEGSGVTDEWFEFDRLLFETGSATLRPESQEQLRNIAAILQAYPNAEIKIGGYTDNQGDPASNLQLSRDRAQNVRSSLVALGVGANRLDAEGYGEQYPVASNATEAGRARNRRIALHVTPQ